MKKLHSRWGDRVQFVDVVIRQAHPGPKVPPYRNHGQKIKDARRYRQEKGILWPVLADDLEGTVHQTYGGLTDPVYLIDREGRVAYYNMWTHVPAVHEAIEELIGQGGRGVVKGGVSRLAHLGPAISNGWPALQRGLPQSFVDLETAAPSAASGAWLGYKMRPLLAPLTLRDTPLPTPARVAFNACAVALLMLAIGRGVIRRGR